jgi:hypothetical protein
MLHEPELDSPPSQYILSNDELKKSPISLGWWGFLFRKIVQFRVNFERVPDNIHFLARRNL